MDSNTAETVQLSVSSSALNELSSHKKASFTMETAMGSITLDATALASAADWAQSRTITVLLTAAQDSKANNTARPLWAWKILCDQESLTDLHGGQAKIAIPHTLEPQQSASGILVQTQNASGGWSEVHSSYDASSKTVHFTATAPCVFTVGYDETLAWSGSFADVDKQSWYYPAVRYVCYHDIMTGTSANTFAPEGNFSRAQMAQILYALEGRPQVDAAAYADVSPDAWYAAAISWAVKAGVLTGYGDGRIGPNDPITREQLAVMLYRYAEQKGLDTSVQTDLSSFADVDTISSYARQPLAWAYASGIVSGTDTAQLLPAGTATRAQSATMMMQFHKIVSAS